MTNKEAIKMLQANVIYACEKAKLSDGALMSVKDALDMAISALEKQSRIITVTDAEGGLIASISDKDIIEENGVHVIISEE